MYDIVTVELLATIGEAIKAPFQEV